MEDLSYLKGSCVFPEKALWSGSFTAGTIESTVPCGIWFPRQRILVVVVDEITRYPEGR